MDLIELVNKDISKAGGIAKYYEMIMAELFPQPIIKDRKYKSPTRYRFTTEYLKKNCDHKSLTEMANEIGVAKSQITRRLKQLGIVKKHKFPEHNRETCLIINLESGIFYSTMLQASDALGFDRSTFARHIRSSGQYKMLKVA